MQYPIARLARMRRLDLQAVYLQLASARSPRAIEQIQIAAAAASNDALMSRILDAQ